MQRSKLPQIFRSRTGPAESDSLGKESGAMQQAPCGVLVHLEVGELLTESIISNANLSK